jgi:hypothetical protein
MALWAAFRATVLRPVSKSNVFWARAAMWLAYAGWEWLVLVMSPEANIRVDLLLIWPVIALATLWAVVSRCPLASCLADLVATNGRERSVVL